MRLAAFLVILMLAEAPGPAQMSGGSIRGQVTDSLNGVVQDAIVSIDNRATGEKRVSKTNERGFYAFPNLSPGRYNMSVSHAGFGDLEKKNLLVDVAEQLIVDFELEAGAVATSVEVTDRSLEVSLASSSLINVVGGQTVRDLPLNGRDWTLLAALEPGVHTIEAQTAISAGSNGREDRGWGTEMTIGGSRPQQNNYRLDGISINDFTGSGPGNVLGSLLGTDAIQEYSVVTGIASADYGKTSGGVINAVTRTGSNNFHGSAYEFLRNSAIDARNFFDGSQAPPFRRNQFGATIGGPIRRSRTFFFFNYEGLRQDLSSTTITTVPSQAARTGRLVSGRVAIDPKVAPYLQIFPFPNGLESGDAGIYSFVSKAVTSVNFFTGRLDHAFSDRDSIHGGFLVGDSRTTSPDGTDFVITGQVSHTRIGSIEETHVFRPNLMNIVRAGINRAVSEAPIQVGAINPLATDTSLGYLPNTPVGGLTITGLTSFNGGVGGAGKNDFHFTSWQLYDDLSYTRGAHSVELGIALERIESNEAGNSNPNGRFTFGSLQAFLTNRPQSFNAAIPGKSPAIYLRQFIPAFYVRDDYRLLANLTLNLGFRYEMATVPSEKYDRLSHLDSLMAAAPRLGSPYFHNPTLRDVSPRIGFAWDPFRSGKTAVRGGFGIYDTLPLTYQFELLAINEAPFFQTGSLTTLAQGAFPAGALPLLTPNSLGYAWVQPDPHRSYVEQWNLTLQRWFPGGVIATAGYSGQHGLHQPLRTTDANLVLPTQTAQGLIWPVPVGSGARLNPSIGAINSLAWLSSNSYEAANAAVAWEQKGVRLGVAYTFSKSIDDSSSSIAVANFNNSVVGSFIFNPHLARGLSDFDVRQNLVVNATWLLPRRPSARGFVKWAVDQWQVGAIFRASAGLPFTPVIGGDPLGMKNSAAFDFPDRLNLPACNNPVNPGNATRYIKTQCFAAPQPATRLGDSGRNIAIGPGLDNLDLSLFKNNHIHNETINIQFRAEVFNALNHANFAVPDRTSAQIFTQTFSPVATAGLLKTTSTTSRQIQLAVKCIFLDLWTVKSAGIRSISSALAVSLLAPWAAALNPALDVNEYAHASWKVGEGFSKGAVHSIAQTPDGYLWLGTEFGLLRFDGVRVVPWPIDDSLPSTQIRTLLAARDGTLWMGTSKGLASMKTGDLAVTRYSQLQGSTIFGLVEDRTGDVWVGGWSASKATVCSIGKAGIQCSGANGIFGFTLSSVYRDRSDNIWVGAVNGVWRWHPGPPRFYPLRRNSGVDTLAEDENGELLLAQAGSMRRLVNGRAEIVYSLPAATRGAHVRRILRDRDGALWVGTLGRGLVHIHQGRTEVFARADGLSGDDITTIFEDREGAVWVGTLNGLDGFHDIPVITYSEPQGLSSGRIVSVLAAKDGSIWMRTLDGLNRLRNHRVTIYREHNNGFTPVATPSKSAIAVADSNVSEQGAGSLYQDANGRVWVSTPNAVGYMEDDRFVRVPAIPAGRVHSIVGDRKGGIWFAHQERGLLRWEEGGAVRQTSWRALGREGFADALAADPIEGGLWIGFFRGGLLYFQDGKILKSYTAADGLGEGRVNDLRIEADGTLWITTEGGLSRLKNGRLVTLTSKNGLGCDRVHWSIEDDLHSVWLYTSCGLVRISRASLDAWAAATDNNKNANARIQPAVFDSSDGVRSRANAGGFSPHVAKSTDGKLWFFPLDGLASVDPARLPQDALPPPVHIERLRADRSTNTFTSDPASRVILPPLIRDLEIDYTAISTNSPEKLRFRYMLEGRDRDWTDAGARRQVFYNDLPPGNYRFRVSATTNGGSWSAPGAVLDFRVAPAYYQTEWFQAFGLAAFVMSLVAAYQYRLNQLARQFKMRVEERVSERTRIARDLHDTLLQSFQGALLKLGAAVYQIPDRDSAIREKLDALIDEARQAIIEGRNAIQGLRSSTVLTNELAQAIRAIGEEVAAQPAEHCPAFRLTAQGEPRDLPPLVRDEIFRIAVESIRNSFAHAQASRIEVELHYQDRQFRLLVRDDGKGIDPEILAAGGRAGHHGIPGLRERAAIVEGKLEVRSKPGAGTEIELLIPASYAYVRPPRRRLGRSPERDRDT